MQRLFILLLFFFHSIFSYAQFGINDSVKNLLKNLSDDTLRLQILFDVIENTSDDKVWPQYNQQALELSQKLSESNNGAFARKGKEGLAKAYNNIGYLLNLQENVPKALDNFRKALTLREELGNKQDLSETLHNIGTVYYKEGDITVAQDYFERSLKLSEEINDTESIAIALNYLGMVYMKQKEYAKSNANFQRSLKMLKYENDETGIANTYNNISMIQLITGKPDSAYYYLQMALRLHEKTGDKLNIAITVMNIGKVLLKQNKLDAALQTTLRSLKLSQEVGFPEEISYSEQLLSDIYNAKKEPDSALVHFKKYIMYRDSVKNAESRKATLKFEYERKETALKAEQDKKDALAKKEIEKQKILKNSFIVGAILLLLVTLLLYNRNRIKHKATIELTQAYNHLTQTQQQLIYQEKNASLGQLTAGIAHEIKNPLNFVTNFSQLSEDLIAEIKNTLDEKEKAELFADLEKNISKIKQHGKRADQIVQSMLQHSRSAKAIKQPTNINTLCDEFTHLAFTGMQANIAGFECEVEKHLEQTLPNIEVIQQDISRVILNLLNNAFYSVNKKKQEEAGTNQIYRPKVTLTTRLVENKIIISISDNGLGISSELQQKLFEPFFTTKPTGEGTGLGLSICNDILKAHGGNIRVESGANSLTTFIISLPC